MNTENVTGFSHFALLPRDGLFCKDARGWHAGLARRGAALDWPWPSTILGSLCTASGLAKERQERALWDPKQWERHRESLDLRALLTLRRPLGEQWKTAHRLWPVPADALWLSPKQDCGKECTGTETGAKAGDKGNGKSRLVRLDPQPPADGAAQTLGRAVRNLPAGEDQERFERAREALWRPTVNEDTKPVPAPRWWEDAHFVTWLLCGGIPEPEPPEWSKKPLRRHQVRVRIGSDTGTVEDEALFSQEVIETLDRPAKGDGADSAVACEWAIGVQASLPGTPLETPWNGARAELLPSVRIGGDRRLAFTENLPVELFRAPEELLKAFAPGRRGLRLVTVTPALFARGWLPDGFAASNGAFQGRLSLSEKKKNGDKEEDVLIPLDSLPKLILRAAFVARPAAVGGWDMAAKDGKGQPKKTERLVPPGAVYFFEVADNGTIGREQAEKLWLARLGGRTREGFGAAVPGIWEPNNAGAETSEPEKD